jgi:hypothetical protein
MAGVKKPKSDGGTSGFIACECVSAYQDSKYGVQRRVANKGNAGWKCTVCGRVVK